jgi:hypothetical protein
LDASHCVLVYYLIALKLNKKNNKKYSTTVPGGTGALVKNGASKQTISWVMDSAKLRFGAKKRL